MTSGGSESILSAMKASRDYMRAQRGIDEAEMIVAVSAHAAYWKAAEYFRIKLVTVGGCCQGCCWG
jgi:sphinganine-1-phosphate aldolase